MAGSQRGQAIPTQLGLGTFEQFVLPHLSRGSRGPAPKLSLFKIFLAYPVNAYTHYMWGCQWQTLRKSSLEGIVHFECRVVQKQRWELSFEVGQYVVWGRRIEDHVLACRFVWATTESAQETNRRGWVRRNDPFQRNAFFG